MKSILRKLLLKRVQTSYLYSTGKLSAWQEKFIYWVTDGEHHLFG